MHHMCLSDPHPEKVRAAYLKPRAAAMIHATHKTTAQMSVARAKNKRATHTKVRSISLAKKKFARHGFTRGGSWEVGGK